jgi:hypothetical protein
MQPLQRRDRAVLRRVHLVPLSRDRFLCLAGRRHPTKDIKASPYLPPEILESVRCQFGVSDRVLDVAMPKIRLQGPCVMAGIGKGEAARVAQHVRVTLERKLGRHAGTFDHLGEAGR